MGVRRHPRRTATKSRAPTGRGCGASALAAEARAVAAQLQDGADLAEALEQVGDVPAPGPLGPVRPHVRHERLDHLPDRRPGREGQRLAPVLGRLELPQPLLGDLVAIRLQGPASLPASFVPLEVERLAALLEARHGDSGSARVLNGQARRGTRRGTPDQVGMAGRTRSVGVSPCRSAGKEW